MAESTESKKSEVPAAPAPTIVSATNESTVEVEGLHPTYTNFVKVSSAPEELVLDFALNPNLPGMAPAAGSIKLGQRLVMNFYTAKRLWGALGIAINRHEQAFGVLETDVVKRLRPEARAGR